MSRGDRRSVAANNTASGRFRITRLHVISAAGLACAMFLAGIAVGSYDSVGAAEADGVLFGAYAQPRGGQSAQAAVQALEADLGSKLPIVRDFARWDSKIDNRFTKWVVDGNRRLMVSVKPKRGNGQRVDWRSIANAHPGSKIHDEMVALARGVKRLDGDVWFTFHHEPEAKDRQIFGNNSDYKNAWRAIHEVFEQENADVKWVWTMTSWSFEVNTADRRSAAKWYPGDPFVDYLGADPYNWNRCRGNNKEIWTQLERVIAPFVEFAQQHPDKQLVLPEFGSDEGGPGEKAAWLDAVRSYLKRPENASRFAAVIYFHDEHEDNKSCTWWLDSSSQTLDAARRIAADPFFDRNVAGTPQSPIPPPAGCTVRSTASGNRLDWPARGSAWKWNIRRNGRWLASTSAESHLHRNTTTGSYVVIGRSGGQRVDLTCRRV